MADDLDELKRRLRTYTKGWHPGVEEMREQAADALDRLTASLAAKEAEIASLRADLKVKQIVLDEALAQGERQRKVIEGLRAMLQEVRDRGLIYWEPNTTRGHTSKAEMLADIDRALSQSPADALARREARRT